MKFGRVLREARLPKWWSRYIDYKTLKRIIKSFRKQATSVEPHDRDSFEKPFMHQVISEMKKIEAFFTQILNTLQVRQIVLQHRIEELESLSTHTMMAAKISLGQALQILRQAIDELVAYADVNSTGFMKITKKFDKRFPGSDTSAKITELLSSTSFSDSKVLKNVSEWCSESVQILASDDMPHNDILRNLHEPRKNRKFNMTKGATHFHEMFSLAVRNQDSTAVSELLPHLTEVDFIEQEGYSCLGLACENADERIVALLLGAGASVSCLSPMDRTPLHLASISGSLPCISLLLASNAPVDALDVEIQAPLHYCAIRNDAKGAALLIESGKGKIDIRNMHGDTPLAVAASLGNLDVLETLIALGARIDCFNWQSRVPLHHAASAGRLSCVKSLLKAGASLASFDINGRSPVHAACRNGSGEVLQLLLSQPDTEPDAHSMLKNAVDIEGLSPLHEAAIGGNIHCIKLLLEANVDPLPMDQSFWSPRDHALYHGHLDCAELFPAVNPPEDPKSAGHQYVEETSVLEHIVVDGRRCSSPVECEDATIQKHHHHLRKVTLRVRARVDSERYVCVCGDGEVLGNWEPSRAPRMRVVKDSRLDDGDVKSWTLTLDLPMSLKNPSYKYLIYCRSVLEVWEVLPQNRVLNLQDHQVLVIDDGFFGHHGGDTNGVLDESSSWTAQGWLVKDYQLHIRLGHVTGKEKREPVVLNGVDRADMVEIGYCSKTGDVSQTRHLNLPPRDADDVVKFQMQERSDHKILDFYIFFSVFCGRGYKIGAGAAMSSNLIKSMQGVSSVPIFVSNLRAPIGELSFEYLFIRPFIHPNMKTVLNRCFSKSTKLIGHRGAGARSSSGAAGSNKCLQTQENTILSFITAAALGAEYIEFDVQLTKDRVPVIYHDFVFHLPGVSDSVPPIPLSLLTLEQFQSLRNAHHCSATSEQTKPLSASLDDFDLHVRRRGSVAYNEIRDAFPTLQDAFKHVPDNVGFNIELKYPPEIAKSELGVDFIGRNEYVDGVLNNVFDHAKDRRVIFSSFDPDVCTLTSLKQPEYPVLFLTEAGGAEVWDPRGASIRAAIRFASTSNFLGICSFADPLLKSPKIVSTIKAAGLVLCTWSSINNNVENVKLSHIYGVDAVVVDRIAYIADELRKKD